MPRFASLCGLLLILGLVYVYGIPGSRQSAPTLSGSSDVENTASPDSELQPQSGSSSADTGAVAGPPSNPAQLPASIDVFGRITDPDGRPIEAVRVSDEQGFGHVESDENGEYRIAIATSLSQMPFLKFLRSGFGENRLSLPVQDIDDSGRLEINVEMRESSDTTRVEGWVGSDLGIGRGGLVIELRGRSVQNTGTLSYAVISDEVGNFSFEGIRADLSYRLEIAATDTTAGLVMEPFWVTESTPRTVILLETLDFVDQSGMIVDYDNAPVADFSINVQNVSVDFPDRRITSDSSGFFSLKRFPAGEIKLSTNSPDYFKISGLTLRRDDYRSLNIAIDHGNWHLTGWVSDENGVPLYGARVSLNAVFLRDEYHSYSYRSALTDASGEFSFQNLGALERTLSVYSAGYDTRVLKINPADLNNRIHVSLGRDER